MNRGSLKKSTFILVLTAVLIYVYISDQQVTVPGKSSPPVFISSIQQAYENQRSNLQVRGVGVVSRILPDDNEGSRHQRFILDLKQGNSLLVAHNIDLAPRINALRKGDKVEFHGEYEWNPKGGVLHWTHHDPANRHTGGWLKHDGRIYQ